jgi:hypothetical protein
MKFYRGLNLDQSDIDYISKHGDCDFNNWGRLMKPTIDHHNLSVSEVISKIQAEPDDIQRYNRDSNSPEDLGKYVTGCLLGATIYSNDNSEKEKNVVIEIEAPSNKVFVDGRDFLYSAVPKLIHISAINANLLNLLSLAFGKKLIQYINAAGKLRERENHIIFRLVDYICMDNSVIKSHHMNNQILIQGRYSTKFLSAFAIIGGIKPEMIKGINVAQRIDRQVSLPHLKSIFYFKDSIDVYDI